METEVTLCFLNLLKMYGLLCEDFRVSLKLINRSILELPSGDFSFEQDIEFAIGATFGLREAEKGPDQNRKANTAPEKSSLARPVPAVLLLLLAVLAGAITMVLTLIEILIHTQLD
jgi:hypothetical protein